MLAQETRKAFNDDAWLFEIKWDGYRAIAEIENGSVKLYSRNGLPFENTYPLIVEALKTISENCILDGEIVVLNDAGVPVFQLLQDYGSNTQRVIQYYVFDLLAIKGIDVCDLPLIERKELLKKLIKPGNTIKYSDHIAAEGKAFFEATKEQNLEGIMAKKSDSQYYKGKRTNEWLKIKHSQTQEAIIAGYTAPGGARQYFGALVLGEKEGNVLKYIGHTGSGFNQQSLADMHKRLLPLVQQNSPFAEKVTTNMPVTWVKPQLVCEVKYSEVTQDGKLRHPIFLHLRNDKDITEINSDHMLPAHNDKKKTVKGPNKESNNTISFGKIKVMTSHIEKVYFPKDNITKGDVIQYYRKMSDYILPYLKGRPESLLRTPDGIHSKGFFHKDAGEKAPAYVQSEKIYSESTKKDIDYIICNNQPTLTYLNNLGCIEINPWHSTLKSLDYPDYMIIDIDPSDKNTFNLVIEAANVVKQILDKAGAISYCKTSGASGLHVYVPMGKKYNYDQVKNFAYLVCMLASEQLAAFTTLERNLKKRGDEHIYMDYLQNRRGQTISCVYSLRPRDGATISTPLNWNEVTFRLTPLDFNIKNFAERILKTGDIFRGVLGKGVNIKKCLKNLET